MKKIRESYKRQRAPLLTNSICVTVAASMLGISFVFAVVGDTWQWVSTGVLAVMLVASIWINYKIFFPRAWEIAWLNLLSSMVDDQEDPDMIGRQHKKVRNFFDEAP